MSTALTAPEGAGTATLGTTASQVEAVATTLQRLLCDLALTGDTAEPPTSDIQSRVDTLRSAADALTAAVASLRNDSGELVPERPWTPDASEEPSFSDDLAMLQMDPELAEMFFGEALDHLGTIESVVLQLESAPENTSLLNDIFRPFHTVKGNAGALGVSRVQELAHLVENLLDQCRAGEHAFGPSEVDVTLESVDLLTALVLELKSQIGGHPAAMALEPRRLALMTTVQRLVDGQAPIVVNQTEALPAAAEAAVTATAPATAPSQTRDPASFTQRADDAATLASVKVDTRKLDNLVDMVGELVIAQSILQEDPALVQTSDERLSRNLAQLKRITSDLQRNAMSMRMVPIRQTFQKMSRLVRDLSRKSGKLVDLVLTGEDTELDRRVVEDINDPLMHMVRNSVDHGIEDPSRRSAAGKRPEGRLHLSATHQGGAIVISISDDGNGLNTERILATARSRGLVQPGDTPSTAEIHQMIFRPGFSTAEKVTEISGRGVGMDVVRRNIEALRGRIEIHSTPGQGTTFQIILPLTLAIIDGLVVGIGSERCVIPCFAVRESLRPTPEQVHSIGGKPRMLQVRDRLVPLVRLSDIYRMTSPEAEVHRSTVVVIEDDGRQVGLVVDALLGKQEVVIKSLGDSFGQMASIAGGAILGDGRVGLILDARGIVVGTSQDSSHAA